MAEPTYSKQQIKAWQQKLEEAALLPRTTFTKRQAVEALIDTIEQALLTRSYGEVAAGLSEWGLDISEGSLKQYVSRYRKTARAKGTKATARKRTAAATKTTTRSPARATGQEVPGTTKGKVAQKDETLATATANRKGRAKRFVQMPEDL